MINSLKSQLCTTLDIQKVWPDPRWRIYFDVYFVNVLKKSKYNLYTKTHLYSFQYFTISALRGRSGKILKKSQVGISG